MKYIKYLILIIILFLLQWNTYAALTVSSSFSNWLDSLHTLLTTLYLIIRPFLIIWWKFLSNTFVYGSAFGIDNVLWQLWQLVRTFTNYIIWFVFLFSIFVYFFKWDSKYSWKKLLPKIIIAWVVVNMSWFLLAVLLDFSTILLVAAWGIWHQFTNISQKTNSNIKKDVIRLPLTFNTDKWMDKLLYVKIKGTDNLCQNKFKEDVDECYFYQCIYWDWGKILNAPCLSIMNWNFVILKNDGTKNNTLTDKLIENWITIKDIDYSSVWQLFSLFRYMNTSFLTDNTNSLSQVAVLTILKLILLVVLIIPFILLAIILVIRVLILWVVIPMSPIILWAYILWIWDSQVKWKLKDIISLIFQPVYVVFMLSIWFIFIQAVHTMIPSPDKTDKKTILEQLQFTPEWENGISLWWLAQIQVKYNKDNWKTTNNVDPKNILSYFSWIIANLFSAIVMWILVFIALKSNKWTKQISSTVETYAWKAVTTTPIIAGQSIDSMKKVTKWLQNIPNWMKQGQQSELTNKFEEIFKWEKDDSSDSSSS